MTGEDMIKEALDKHSQEEIIEYLYTLTSGVLYNYNAAMKSKSPDTLYGNIGDITQMYRMLKEMNRRNKSRAIAVEKK